jgi:hypothetical protein
MKGEWLGDWSCLKNPEKNWNPENAAGIELLVLITSFILLTTRPDCLIITSTRSSNTRVR